MAINKTPDFEAMYDAVFKQLAHNVGQMALSHFKGSFRKGGFTDSSFVPWAKRKGELAHPLMRKSNALMEDIKVLSETVYKVEVGTTMPYAAIHNFGGKFSIIVTLKMRKYFWAMYKQTGQERFKFMAITKKKRLLIRIAQRQFIGKSKVLDKNIDKLIIKTMQEAERKIFKKHG